MKILFINFGGLGDEILFLPTIISVKKQFPDAEIGKGRGEIFATTHGKI